MKRIAFAFFALAAVGVSDAAWARGPAGEVVATGKTDELQFQVRRSPANAERMEITLFRGTGEGGKPANACTLALKDWLYRDPSGHRVQYAFFEADLGGCGKAFEKWTSGRTQLKGYLKPRTQRARGSLMLTGPQAEPLQLAITEGWLRREQ